MKEKLKNFSKKFGEGTAWDLDYGKLLIIGLLIYHIFIQQRKAMTLKKHQNPKGGLNAAGRAHYNRKDGGNLKAPVKKTPPAKSKDFKRKVSFAARFAGMKGPMKKPNGEPTRKALALKAWGFGSVEAARNFANRHKAK